MARKLHIGGQLNAQGWEVLDVNAGPAVDHVRNASDLGCFPEATFSAVYASHVVEHFDYIKALPSTLKEWHRVMEPGGTLYVSVPDLDILARLFIDRARLSLAERFLVMRMIFGGHVDANDYHLVGLNEEFLTDYLRTAGFVDMQKVATFGIFNDTSELRMKGVPISLNMKCIKPR